MKYFTKEYIQFFKELEKNNSKDWFDKNRKRYEKEVREPWKVFIDDLIKAYEKNYGPVPLTSKEAVTRINRDIRFSKDKTPYKDHMGAMISRYGKKNMSHPGIYIQANHKDIRMYSGAAVLDKEQLHKVRSHLMKHADAFKRAINAKPFRDTFSDILGEKNKRIPPEFRDAAENLPVLYQKNFYYFFTLSTKDMLEDGLIIKLMKEYKKCDKVSAFFEDALSNS